MNVIIHFLFNRDGFCSVVVSCFESPCLLCSSQLLVEFWITDLNHSSEISYSLVPKVGYVIMSYVLKYIVSTWTSSSMQAKSETPSNLLSSSAWSTARHTTVDGISILGVSSWVCCSGSAYTHCDFSACTSELSTMQLASVRSVQQELPEAAICQILQGAIFKLICEKCKNCALWKCGAIQYLNIAGPIPTGKTSLGSLAHSYHLYSARPHRRMHIYNWAYCKLYHQELRDQSSQQQIRSNQSQN